MVGREHKGETNLDLEPIKHHMRKCMRDSDQDFYDGLVQMANDYVLDGAVIAEIGVYAGESTRIFMETSKVRELWAIDIWKDGYNDRDQHGKVYPMWQVRCAFFDNLDEFKDKLVVLQATSLTAARIAPDCFFDLVYIDGNHDLEPVTADITAWLPKVKPGGVISGHDYQGSWPGVIQAVDSILGGPDRVYKDTSWVKKV